MRGVIAPHKGGGVTKPGGHFQKIQAFQKGLRKRLAEILKHCKKKDGCGGGLVVVWPKPLDDLVNMPVPEPVKPKLPVPIPQPAPDGPLRFPDGTVIFDDGILHPDGSFEFTNGAQDMSLEVIPAAAARLLRLLGMASKVTPRKIPNIFPQGDAWGGWRRWKTLVPGF